MLLLFIVDPMNKHSIIPALRYAASLQTQHYSSRGLAQKKRAMRIHLISSMHITRRTRVNNRSTLPPQRTPDRGSLPSRQRLTHWTVLSSSPLENVVLHVLTGPHAKPPAILYDICSRALRCQFQACFVGGGPATRITKKSLYACQNKVCVAETMMVPGIHY